MRLAKSGGLWAYYFNNVYLFEPPAKIIVDPEINMDWGHSYLTSEQHDYVSVRCKGPHHPSSIIIILIIIIIIIIIHHHQSNCVSVRWKGKVLTQYSEVYTFYATTDDGGSDSLDFLYSFLF